MDYLPGDVFLTRNIPELNQSPGYWQHAAICNTSGKLVIEGQAEPGKVIIVTLAGFLSRNPERIHLRPKDAELGKKAAEFAEDYVGYTYNRITFNCVTLIRTVYGKALGYDPYWLMPDGLYRSSLFDRIDYYENYKNWKKPEDWYEGRLTF